MTAPWLRVSTLQNKATVMSKKQDTRKIINERMVLSKIREPA
jgi:hypothetical protein